MATTYATDYATYATDQFEIPRAMKIALIISLLFHISVVILGSVGLPYILKPPIIPPQPIAIEIVDISAVTTTDKKPSKSRLKPALDKPLDPLKAKEKIEAPPKVETKEPPKIKPLDKPAKKKDTVKPQPKVPPPPSESLEKPKPPEKKTPDKEEAIEQEDQFLSVLKNLQDGDVATQEAPTDKPTPQEMSPLAKFSQKLSASEIDAIAAALNAQFSGCWNLMAGARNAEDITVTLNLIVNRNRTIQSARIADQWRYNQDSFFKAAADSALRAIRHPDCQVLDLPPDKYDLWKDLVFNFNPASQL